MAGESEGRPGGLTGGAEAGGNTYRAEDYTAAGLDLQPRHAALLAASAIAPQVAAARGYRTVTTKAELKERGFGEAQRRVPALLIPIHGVTGEVGLYQIRPNEPRIVKGKALKYETPAGDRMMLDVPPSCRPQLGNPSIPLFITEGSRKADAAASKGLCCVSVLGVWNWRGSNEYGGKVTLVDWDAVALNGRQVHVAFDSDVMLKPSVHAAMARMTGVLAQRGARVAYIYLAAGDGAAKVGLDDYLAAGHGVDDLLRLASRELRSTEEETDDLYQETPAGLVYQRPTQNGPVPVRLTNFTARIVGDITEDDGAEQRRLYEMEASLGGRPRQFTIPASSFMAMNWPAEHLGANAIVNPGFGLRGHVPVAIQHLSGQVPERQAFSHLGWREIDGRWFYLHAGGAIGPDGPANDDVEMHLGESLSLYRLPDPPEGDELRQAIRASLSLLDVASDTLTVPLLATTYRAVLGGSDFSHHIAGQTGAGKTALAALAQQHFGPEMDGRHSPATWASTANALEALAFAVKDALLLVDDFVPAGTSLDVQRLHGQADRLLRAQGNRSGRGRLRSDTSARPTKPPRGLIISTGEDTPRGQSLGARMLTSEMRPEDLDWGRLGVAQEQAASGVFASAMAGFIHWLAPMYGKTRDDLRVRVVAERDRLTDLVAHRRTPEIIANLSVGLQYLLLFALQTEAITADEAEAFGARCERALVQVAESQAVHQASLDPVRRFLELLNSAISSGGAHVAAVNGDVPDKPQAWGWRQCGDGQWNSVGRRIGWVDGHNLYLDQNAAFAAAQDVGRGVGEGLMVSATTLSKRLDERGLLLSKRAGHLTTRVTLDGRRRPVLHVASSTLETPGQSGHGDRIDGCGESEMAVAGPISWPDYSAEEQESGQGSGQESSQGEPAEPSAGTAGPIGPPSRVEEARVEQASGDTMQRCHVQRRETPHWLRDGKTRVCRICHPPGREPSPEREEVPA